ncbi:MATE family efflux transporter [Liberiplasma polymorphum]|jgi:putative MATE family efflux protein|uniref:MATE family efflux transporter n=1 Tax=Liberiplasma polymorphum TaxID=3374570 RepID=UPI003771565C
MSKERSVMLGEMNVRKLLIKLAIPATIAMMANALYNLVDTFFIALGAGEIAIGALGIVYPIQMIVMAIGLMIGMGSASIFSRAYGRGDQDAMTRSVNTALLINFIISITITILGLIYIDRLLIFFGASAGNIGYARDYMFYILIALVPFSSGIVLNNLARAEGRPKIAMNSLLIGALLNILLDPILIFGLWFIPQMGVTGAAVATLIAKTVAFVYIFRASTSKESSLNIHLRTIHKFDFHMTKDIVIIGLPTFVRSTLGAVLVIIINNLINVYAPADVGPEIYISIYSVINRMILFLLLPGLGLVQGLTPIVGFNFGAKFHKRLYDVISYTTRLIVIYFTLMFVVTILSAELLFNIFSRENDPFFIAEGAKALRIISVGFTVLGFQILLSAVYQAMGYPVRAFLVAISRQFLLFIPIIYVFTYFMGLPGIWLTFVAADLIAGILSFIVYKFEMKDLKRKIPLEAFGQSSA